MKLIRSHDDEYCQNLFLIVILVLESKDLYKYVVNTNHSTSAATSASKKDGEKSSKKESLLNGGGVPQSLQTKNRIRQNVPQFSTRRE